MDVDSVADELYGLRPAEFTALRERRAAEARTAGDREAADRIRALRRPTLAAWASNLLVRARPDEARALVALGDGLREAHRDLDGARLRELGRQQHVVVAALAREAQRLTAEAGEKIGEAARAQVEATLHAALADPDAAEAWVTGRLGKALSAPVGFAAAGLGGEAGARHLSVVPTPPGTTEDAPRTGKAGGPRAKLSLVGHRSRTRTEDRDDAGTARTTPPDAAAARRAREEREAERRDAEAREAERRRAEEQVIAAQRDAAARQDAARHAVDALEGAEQRAREADLRVEELTALLKEAQARRDAAHGTVREAKERVREAEKAAREAAQHAREAERRARGATRRGRSDGR